MVAAWAVERWVTVGTKGVAAMEAVAVAVAEGREAADVAMAERSGLVAIAAVAAEAAATAVDARTPPSQG